MNDCFLKPSGQYVMSEIHFLCGNCFISELPLLQLLVWYKVDTIMFISFKSNQTLEKSEGSITNVQSRETGNIGYIRHKTKTTNQ